MKTLMFGSIDFIAENVYMKKKEKKPKQAGINLTGGILGKRST